MTTRRSNEPILPRRLFTRRRAMELGGATAISASLSVPLLTTAASGSNPVGQSTVVDLTLADSAVAESAVVEQLQPEIKPRAAWAGELPVTGEILAEEDVRFLLVHHTASTNDYQPEDVAAQIRDFYDFHTGPDKGWPDVAYNFFVDRFGGIWEARAGSIVDAVRGDATGGSQGHALLCSLIGDHSKAEVTPEAKAAMTSLLAWLSVRYKVDTTPGTTITFASRGSNRWPEGTEVTARTISGHRDMSTTACPGDFAYDWIGTELPIAVSETVEAAMADAVILVPTTDPPSAEPDSTTTTGTAEPEQTADPNQALTDDTANGAGGDGLGDRFPLIAGGLAAVGAVVMGGVLRLRRRTAAD